MDPPAPFHPTATRRVRQTVRVGVGVVVVSPNNCIYAGIRKSSHGAGTIALPGGHLELYESWQDCARREVKEEMNVELDGNVQFVHVTNDPMPDEQKHYVTIFMASRLSGNQTVQNMEPEKCEGWKEYSWQQLQELESDSKLFGPLARLVKDNPATLKEILDPNSMCNQFEAMNVSP